MALILASISDARSAAAAASASSSLVERVPFRPDDEVLAIVDGPPAGSGPDLPAPAHPRVEAARSASRGFSACANVAFRRAQARGCGLLLLDGAAAIEPGWLDAVDRDDRAIALPAAGSYGHGRAGACLAHVPPAALAALGPFDERFRSVRGAIEDCRLRALSIGIDIRRIDGLGAGATARGGDGAAGLAFADAAPFADRWGEALRSLFLDADDMRPVARDLGVEGLVDRGGLAELVRRYAPPGPDDRRWVKPPRRRLCLHAVVKDGGARLERCLRSAADHVAFWVIADAGSTDGTPERVERFFAERGIPGELHHLPPEVWPGARREAPVAARVEALARARRSPLPYDYLLLMDADAVLDVEGPGFGRGPDQVLDAPAYRLRGPDGRWAPRLIGRDTFGDYRPDHGGAFEVRSVAVRDLSGARLASGADAGDPDPRERDAALDRRDHERAGRVAESLAQAARGRARLDDRDGAPWRLADAAGEAGWRALMEEMRDLGASGRGEEAVELAVAAVAARPRRAEPLLFVAAHLRLRGLDEAAASVAALGLEVVGASHGPDGDLAGRFREELAPAAFSSASPARRVEGLRACDALSMSPGATYQRRFEARRDLYFYAGRLDGIARGVASLRLAIPPEPGWRAMNPSVALWRGALWATVRLVNYRLADSYYAAPEGEPFVTRNLLVRLDGRLGIAALSEVLPPADWPAPLCSVALGFEDMRLIPIGDELWCASSVKERNADGWCEQALARIEVTEGAGPCRLAGVELLRTGEPPAHQKNWTAQVAGSHLGFVHTYEDNVVVSRAGTVVRLGARDGEAPAARDHLRGGSQALPFGGGWLAVCHEVVFIGIRRCYLHRFAWFDADSRLARLSEPFRFDGRDVEFVAGLAFHPDGERLVVSYGVADCEAWLATVPIPEVERLLARRGASGAQPTGDAVVLG